MESTRRRTAQSALVVLIAVVGAVVAISSGRTSSPPVVVAPPVALGLTPESGNESAPDGGDAGPCRTDLDLERVGIDLVDPVATVLAAVAIARSDVDRCGPRPAEEQMCRALWLSTVLDPVVLWIDGAAGERLHAATDARRWAIDSFRSTVAADDGAALALAELEGIHAELTDQLIAGSSTDAGVAELVERRGNAELVQSLRVVEGFCAQSGP